MNQINDYRFSAQVELIPVGDIDVGKRAWRIKKEAVARLAESIRANGLLQPIGVIRQGDRYRLVWGAHRLAAYRELAEFSIEKIPARVLPEDVPRTEIDLCELEENFTRRDLTRRERQDFAVRILKADIGRRTNLEKFQKKWIVDLAQQVGVERRTVQNWWADFAKDRGIDATPARATVAEQQQFAEWLSQRKEKPPAAEPPAAVAAINAQISAAVAAIPREPGPTREQLRKEGREIRQANKEREKTDPHWIAWKAWAPVLSPALRFSEGIDELSSDLPALPDYDRAKLSVALRKIAAFIEAFETEKAETHC